MHNISFIVPAYNAEDTLREAVDSIFNDNLSEGDEVIIVDDASKDGTGKVINELKEKYGNAIVPLTNRYNRGSATGGRNAGIEVSTNDIIFALDQDNLLKKNSISGLKNFLIEKELDAAAFGGLHFFKKDPAVIENIWKLNPVVDLLDALNENQKTPCNSGNYMFTKKVWQETGRQPESLMGALDSWSFSVQLLLNSKRFETLPDTYYLHRYGHDSLFVRASSQVSISISALRFLLPYLDLFNEEDVNFMLANRETWFENNYFKVRLKDDKNAVSINPWNAFMRKVRSKKK